MRTFLLTSKKFEGEIEFAFDDEGRLQGYFNRAQLNEEQKRWLLDKLPKTLDSLNRVLGNGTEARFTEQKTEVTFTMFWDRYNDKVNSSRKNAQRRWDNMQKGEQIKAYQYIGYYFSTLPQGTRKKYAETYLNAELWNN